jgi:hypothetical protein
MLLQGACLVRLGNALLNVRGPSDFTIKAIYINRNYEATEYTLFQRQVAEGLEQHPIRVKNFCVFPIDKALTAHWRSTMSRHSSS